MIDLKNCKILTDNKLVVKMVKMGMDIDEKRNHRIRGIIPTDDNKYIFVEILSGNKPDIKYTNLNKKEYEERFPYDNYIWIDGCFRVDIPSDKFKNFTPEFAKYDRKSFYHLEHTNENIVKLLQEFNKDIVDIELVDYNYIDDFNNENGFYSLYDDRLDHKNELLNVIYMTDNYIQLKEEYTCYNYDHTVEYKEKRNRYYDNYDVNELYKMYGKEIVDTNIKKYNDCFKDILEANEL